MQVRPERGLARGKALGTQLESFQSLAGTASRQNRQKGEWRSRVWTIPSDGGSQGKTVGIGVERGFLNMRYNSLLV